MRMERPIVELGKAKKPSKLGGNKRASNGWPSYVDLTENSGAAMSFTLLVSWVYTNGAVVGSRECR